MKFGIAFANAGPAALGDFAAALGRLAEENGFESLWTVEHVVVPKDYESTYPYSRKGRMPGAENSPIPDPLVWLSYVAAHTTRIRLATGILILPQRNPVIVAKEAATLDALSGGRVILGVGVGWLQEEFDALGVPFEQRGARTDEYIQVLRTLWTQSEPTFHGRFASFEKALISPQPLQTGGIPIVVGGHSDAAARRAGRLGDGFFPGRGEPERILELMQIMRAEAQSAGRDPDAIELTCGGRPDLENVQRFADIGASRFVIPPLAFDIESLKSALGEFSEKVIART